MSFFSFGEYKEGINFKVLDERVIRASSGLMFLLGLFASINAFIFERYIVVPYVAGFLLLNFAISVSINPKFAPTMFLGRLFTYKQSSLPIGAVQKRFAWSLGLALSGTIFALSFYLLKDVIYFDPVCLLCIICLLLLFLESAFGICVGCKLYQLSLYLKIIPKPKEKPNCMGDACATD